MKKDFIVISEMDNGEIAKRVCRTTATMYRIFTPEVGSKVKQVTVWGPITEKMFARAMFK